jgi:hypothetical protein
MINFNMSHGQVLSIEEIDRDGERYPVEIGGQAYPIVDINSTLKVRINKDLVRRIAAEKKPIALPVTSDQIATVTNILQRESQMLALLGPCTRSYEECRGGLRTFSTDMSTILKFVGTQKGLAAKVDSVMGLDGVDAYKVIFTIIREEVSRIARLFESGASEQRPYFRLGGWIREEAGVLRPIHVPEFDKYTDGDFHEVPRFIVPTPAELRKQYEAAREAANDYNQNGKDALIGLKNRISGVRDSVRTMLVCLRNAAVEALRIDSATGIVNREVQPLLKSVDTILQKVNEVEKLIHGIASSRNPLQTALVSLSDVVQLLKETRKMATDLQGVFDSTVDRVKRLGASVVKAKTEDLLTSGSGCLASMRPFLKDIDTVLTTIDDWSRLGVPQQVEVNLQFGEQVDRFLIEDTPDSTQIDLRNTGLRSSGDQIFLKAALEDGPGSERQLGRSTEIERRVFTMFQIDWHAQLSLGAMFLSPFKRNAVAFSKQFQAAPATSLLLKHGSRGSYMYNRFWSVGVGLNLAAPDFDLDGTPEVGLGVVVSTMKDYLQLGVGDNLGVEKWYWFFCLRFPVGTLTTPEIAPAEAGE